MQKEELEPERMLSKKCEVDGGAVLSHVGHVRERYQTGILKAQSQQKTSFFDTESINYSAANADMRLDAIVSVSSLALKETHRQPGDGAIL